jgi:hypothetical protein
MVTLSVFVHMKAKPGKEKEVEQFLKSGLAIFSEAPTVSKPEVLAAKVPK